MTLNYISFPMIKKLSCLLMAVTATLFNPALADSFSATVSPPRFELQGKPGEVIREIVEIDNAGDTPALFALRTADWDLTDSGGLTIFPPELQPNSCRPWVRIERRALRLQAQSGKRFRFEIHVPEDAPEGECRVALLVESGDDSSILARAKNISFPIDGRIAIIIYVSIGNAAPELSVQSLRLQDVNGRLTPVVLLENSGNAHGRPSGFLEGRDASGKRIDFAVAQTPILPGRSRATAIWENIAEGSEATKVTPPLQLKGTIEWRGGKQKIDTTLK
jgi:hypothetical protein